MSVQQLTDLLIRANRENAELKVQLSAYEDLDEINADLLLAIRLIKTEAEEYNWPDDALKNIELTCISLLKEAKKL